MPSQNPNEAYRNQIIRLFVIESALYLAHIFFIFKFPNPAPAHWNDAGVIDAYMNKWWYLIVDFVPFIILWIFYSAPKIDPFHLKYTSKPAWEIFSTFFSIIIIIATWVPEYMILIFSDASKAGVSSIQRMSLLMFGILFLFLGNYLPQIPHNHFFGAATPWTKQDGLIWKKTNHMFSIILFLLGIASILGIFFNAFWVNYFNLFVLFMTLFLYIYSFYKGRRL